MIKVGCCGFRGRREDYFKNFDVVEIQHTFYKIPEIEKARKWRKMAGKDFEFTMKAWQAITHPASSPTYRKAGITPSSKFGFFNPSEEVIKAWEKTRDFAKELKASVIVFQCPPSFKESEENVRNIKNFFSVIGKEFTFALELRGTWKRESIMEICREFDIIHCVDPFKEDNVYGKFNYYRLHGIGSYNYDYSMDELKTLKEKCRDNDYCMFNNTYMLKNALEFKKLISGEI